VQEWQGGGPNNNALKSGFIRKEKKKSLVTGDKPGRSRERGKAGVTVPFWNGGRSKKRRKKNWGIGWKVGGEGAKLTSPSEEGEGE